MLFNSLEYLIFLPLVAALYFIIPQRFRWIFLLLASYWFYMSWKAEYALLILYCTAVNYISAILIERESNAGSRRLILIFDLIISLGVLVFFKYLGFFARNLNPIIEHINASLRIPQFKLLLPIGISFFTFQTLGYTIDVYRGTVKAERHFGIFALFVSFFPQLVAGPIQRSTTLLPQLRQKHRFDIARVTDGLRLILWGLFKKIVIADRLAIIANAVFNNVQSYSAPAYIIATVAFTFQIFCDFSGYSDMAVGSARILGFDLIQNFNRPYFSKSTGEFWRRWHISLSTWFRDYVYIPLGGSRAGNTRYYINNLITFVLSGLWHGANWTFVIWGALNGVYVAAGRATKDIRKKVNGTLGIDRSKTFHKILRAGITFSLISFSWIFFRANTINDALYIITHLIPQNLSAGAIAASLHGIGTRLNAIVAFLGTAVLVSAQYIGRGDTRMRRLFDRSILLRYGCYLLILISVLMFGVTGNETAFIYFKF